MPDYSAFPHLSLHVPETGSVTPTVTDDVRRLKNIFRQAGLVVSKKEESKNGALVFYVKEDRIDKQWMDVMVSAHAVYTDAQQRHKTGEIVKLAVKHGRWYYPLGILQNLTDITQRKNVLLQGKPYDTTDKLGARAAQEIVGFSAPNRVSAKTLFKGNRRQF